MLIPGVEDDSDISGFSQVYGCKRISRANPKSKLFETSTFSICGLSIAQIQWVKLLATPSDKFIRNRCMMPASVLASTKAN